MKDSEKVMDCLLEFVTPFYSEKDIMHDISHINRIRKKSFDLSKSIKCDPNTLEIASFLHGIVNLHEIEIRSFLSEVNFTHDEAEILIRVSLESQKDSHPVSNEGKILHDAHLLEGDENFIITKCLVTGSLRGQSLEETIKYYFKNLYGQFRCCFPQNHTEYEKREQIAFTYFEKLQSVV